MRIAISNIAWTREEDEDVYAVMRETGVAGIEIAPTRVWDTPYEKTDLEIASFKKNIAAAGLQLVAMQSLLFGMPDLKLFGSESSRLEMLARLKKCVILASKLGFAPLVFGSPKNRLSGDLAPEKVAGIASDFFTEIGNFAASKKTFICLEPNPREYGADFLTTTRETIDFVKRLGNPGVKVHLDLGAMTVNGEDYEKNIIEAAPHACHFHVSEPFLGPVGDSAVNHVAVARALISSGYKGWVSIEMRAAGGGKNVESARAAMALAKNYYD